MGNQGSTTNKQPSVNPASSTSISNTIIKNSEGSQKNADKIEVHSYDDEGVIDGSKQDLLQITEAISHQLHKYIGPILAENDKKPGGKIRGTGILISSNLILTVAHNVWYHDVQNQNKNFQFYPGQRGHLSSPLECQPIYYPKQHRQNRSGQFDYALLKLTKPYTGDQNFIPLAQFTDDIDEANKKMLAIYGYPGEYYSLFNSFGQLAANQWGYTRSGAIVSVNRVNGTLYHKISTLQGQSGSPIIQIKRDRSLSIVGIHKGAVTATINNQKMRVNTARLINQELIEIFEQQALGSEASLFKCLKSPSMIVINRLIIVGEGFSGVHLDYQAVKHKTMKDLFKDLDHQKDWSTFGLMINDIVLKNYQKMESVEEVNQLFEPVIGKSQYIFGVVLNEGAIFVKEQSTIEQFASQFNIRDVISKEQRNFERYREGLERIMEKSRKTQIGYFKDMKNVEPIYWYTSSIYTIGSTDQSRPSESLYSSLNGFLRKQNFAQTKVQNYRKHWQYLYTFTLLKSIRELSNIKTIFWRGVNYLPKHQKGDKFFSKQILLVVRNFKTAKILAREALYQIVQSYSAKDSAGFQQYYFQDEYLFPPYCQFEVLQITQIPNQRFNKKILLIKIRQILRKPLPQNIINYIFWVNDNPREIIDIEKGIRTSTVIMKLRSTNKLKKELIKNSELFQKSNIRVLMISNMTRRQGNKDNDLAGVDAIKLLRAHVPSSKVFFYVQHQKEDIEKLEKYGGFQQSDTLQCSSSLQKLKSFLKKHADIE